MSDLTGTADSTLPSPLPEDGVKRRQQLPLEDDPNPNDPYHQDADLLAIPQTTIYPGREPSPEHLAHLLSGLMETESNLPTPPTLGTPFSDDRELDESTVSIASVSPQSGLSRARSDASSTSSRSSRKSLKVKIPTLERRGEGFHVQEVELDLKPDHALTETIKGIYKLWKAERGEEIDKYQFLKVVQNAIEEF